MEKTKFVFAVLIALIIIAPIFIVSSKDSQADSNADISIGASATAKVYRNTDDLKVKYLASPATRISFPYTQSFLRDDEKTKLLHTVTWNLTLTFDFIFPIDVATEKNATEIEPNDYVSVDTTPTAPENEAYCKITVTGSLKISGPQVNKELTVENFTIKYSTTPIGERTIDFPPIVISDAPTLYAFILEPSITAYTHINAETSFEGSCSITSGASLEWSSDGETKITVIHVSIEAEKGNTIELNLIDFSYYLGASIYVTAKLRILTQEAELDTWTFTIPSETVPASDTVTIPLSWNVVPEFTSAVLIITFILTALAVVIAKRKRLHKN